MSRFDDVQAAIVAKLQTISGIGIVQERERFARDQKTLAEFYAAEFDGKKRIQGWFIKREACREISPMIGRTIHIASWKIIGYFVFDDAGDSEGRLNEVIDRIGDAFRDDYTLGGAIVGHDLENNTSGIQLELNENVMFAGVLCHRATLALHTTYYL